MQRLTALALIPLVIWFVVSMIIVTGADHAAAVDFISSPINSVLLILLIIATFYHGQLGLTVVIEDYIHTRWLEEPDHRGQGRGHFPWRRLGLRRDRNRIELRG